MTEKIEFEKIKFAILGYFEKELWEELIALNEANLDISQHVSFIKDDVVMRLSFKVFTHGEGEYNFEWYKSWWQELREKILPRWWIERHPSIVEIKKVIKCIAAYPSIKIGDMEHKAIIQFT